MSGATRWCGFVLLAVALFGGMAHGQSVAPVSESAQGATAAEIRFQFDRPGVPVPHFILIVDEGGAGTYQADQAPVASSDGSVRGQAGLKVDRKIQVSEGTAAKLFQRARALNYFRGPCASKAKHIANTGEKTLSYAGSDGTGSCVFNYSEDANVTALMNTFVAIAFTLDEGRKLEFLHRYDRLGLDEEMNFLTQEAAAGRAQELETIAPALNAIEEDTAVMERVRIAAARLIQQDATTR